MSISNRAISAALFDLDETLVFTNDAHFMAYKESCASQGLKLERSDYLKYVGEDSRKFLKSIFADIDEDIIRLIRNHKSECFINYIEFTHTNEKILELAIEISKFAKIGVVTNAKRKNCLDILNHHQIKDQFDVIINGDSVKTPKPSPEGYLKALTELGISADAALAFEDSEIGVQAANLAGIQVLRVTC